MGIPEAVSHEARERLSDRLHATFFGHEQLTVIEPPRGWHMLDVRELWAYRELLWVLTVRDLKVRYKQTVLGVAWAVLQPLVTMAIFTVIFGRLAGMPSDGYPYAVFVYAGLLPWTFFANTIGAAGGSVVGSASLVSKVYFPRLIVPLTSVGTYLVDLGISSVILLLLMVYYRVGWTANLLAAPILLVGVVFITFGVGTLLAALTVAYRDFRYVVPFLTQIWLYVTPVVYPVSLLPERWRWLLHLNPMTGFIEGFRSVFLGRSFDLAALAISFGLAAFILLVGIAYFERIERRFADII